MPLLATTLLLLSQQPVEAPTPATASTPALLAPLSGRVEQPVELGQVRWRRDFEAGLAEAKRTGKPALLLFQEVPG
jgi:hypothetical protein